jgi:hypothetical protein
MKATQHVHKERELAKRITTKALLALVSNRRKRKSLRDKLHGVL